jgi:pimeloyl-ACP methyl ester carboxylesterase
MIKEQLNNSFEKQMNITLDRPSFAKMQLATGVTLNYFEQGNIDGEAIIMLHGYSDSWNSFALSLPLMSEKYHIFALDQRGHGDSSKDAGDYTMESFAADVVAFMDAKQIKKCTLVGHSMGSLVALLVATHNPERVARLVLIGARANWKAPVLFELNDFVQTLTDPVSPSFIVDFQRSTIHTQVPPEFFEGVIAESAKAPAHVWRQTMASHVQQDVKDGLAEINMPTLILWGEQDSICSRSEQETLSRLIPNAILLTYAETGHALHWERPEQFVYDLERFMQPIPA